MKKLIFILLGIIVFGCLIIAINSLEHNKYITVETYTYFVRLPSVDVNQFMNYVSRYALTVSETYDETSIMYYIDGITGLQKAVVHTKGKVKDKREKH
jgi:hypothetical protein